MSHPALYDYQSFLNALSRERTAKEKIEAAAAAADGRGGGGIGGLRDGRGMRGEGEGEGRGDVHMSVQGRMGMGAGSNSRLRSNDNTINGHGNGNGTGVSSSIGDAGEEGKEGKEEEEALAIRSGVITESLLNQQLGKTSTMLQDFAMAVAHFQAAVEENRTVENLCLLAQALVQSGDMDGAVEALQSACDNDIPGQGVDQTKVRRCSILGYNDDNNRL